LRKKTVRDIDVSGKRVLLRADLNVPIVPGTTTISNDSRIQTVLPTIRYLKKRGSCIVLCSHLGRPHGKAVKEMRLRPVAVRLEALLDEPIVHVRESRGPMVQEAAAELEPGQVLLLENLRFHPEEEMNDDGFARELASLAEVYVNDAFSASHRAHASLDAITRYLPAVAGLQMEREMKMLSTALENPARPMGAVIGGAKVSDKIDVLQNLVQRIDRLFIGGGMSATFFKAQGHEIGQSLVEEERVAMAQAILRNAEAKGVTVHLPQDLVVAEDFATDAKHQTVAVDRVPQAGYVMDIGPATVRDFDQGLRECRTVVWNGPMGVFEFEPFTSGTRAIAETLADLSGAITVVGGGSTAEAVEELGLTTGMNFVSMGGGASLEFLEGREMPGISRLLDKEE